MDFRALTEFLDSLISLGVPGVDCAVSIDGETVYRHYAGFADRENNREMRGDELYHVYSATKLVTCVAALQLLERGRFLLGDRLSDYLPEFRDMSVVEDGTLRPAHGDIRIGNLFTMTAGFSYNIETPAINELRKHSPDCTTREFVAAIAREPLLFDPGAQWNYSLCHDVLGALIEEITHKSFGEYVREDIFEPLGMNNSFFTLPKEQEPRMAAQYIYDDASKTATRTVSHNVFTFGAIESGGAGIISSVDDFILFAEMLANGGVARNGARLLSANTIGLMRENHLNAAQQIGLKRMIGRGMGYGLGAAMIIDRTAAGTLAPNGQFGWGGAAGSQVIIDSESRTALYYAQHMLNNLEHYIQPRLRNILFARV